jgi:hypothetical protein
VKKRDYVYVFLGGHGTRKIQKKTSLKNLRFSLPISFRCVFFVYTSMAMAMAADAPPNSGRGRKRKRTMAQRKLAHGESVEVR